MILFIYIYKYSFFKLETKSLHKSDTPTIADNKGEFWGAALCYERH